MSTQAPVRKRKPTKPAPRRTSPAPVRLGRRGQSGYAAASTSRLFGDWTTGTVTEDSLLRSQLIRMRNRSRDLARNEDYMRALLHAAKSNLIGPTGIALNMDIRDPFTDETDDAANDAIEAAWDQFSAPENFTTARRWARVQFEHNAIHHLVRDGEFLFRVHRGWGNPFRFAVQPIAADYLDEEKNDVLTNGTVIRMGVERTATGEHVGYWIRTYNPGDTYWAGKRSTSERFSAVHPEPATGQMAGDIKHVYLENDFDVSRGLPWIHAGATRLKMLSGYEEAALEASRAAACKHEYFMQKPDSNGDYKGDAVDAEGNYLSDMEPGTKEVLPVGMEPYVVDPKYPHNEHKGFITATLGGVAAGLGLSAMTLTGDLSQANYSSMRAGLLPERDLWRLLQGWFILNVELPIFRDWLEFALLAGAIRLPNGTALPAGKFEKFNRPIFAGRRWGWVDPEKDQRANVLSLENKLISRTQIVSEQGNDLEDTWRTLQREEKMAVKYGIELEAPEPAAPPASPQPAEDPEEDDPPIVEPPPAPREAERIEALQRALDDVRTILAEERRHKAEEALARLKAETAEREARAKRETEEQAAKKKQETEARAQRERDAAALLATVEDRITRHLAAAPPPPPPPAPTRKTVTFTRDDEGRIQGATVEDLPAPTPDLDSVTA